jgi:hypothetical protein
MRVKPLRVMYVSINRENATATICIRRALVRDSRFLSLRNNLASRISCPFLPAEKFSETRINSSRENIPLCAVSAVLSEGKMLT